MEILEKKYLDELNSLLDQLMVLKKDFVIDDFEKWKHDVLNILKNCLPLEDQRTKSFFNIFFKKREIGLYKRSIDWINYIFDEKYYINLDISKAHGILTSVMDSIEKGLVGDIRNQFTKEIYSITLENAMNFLNEGHLIGAGVYGRIILEQTLRNLCDKADPAIEWKKNDKLAKLRDDLRRNDIISEVEGKQIGFWSDVGNNAAHGKKDELNEILVKNMLIGLQDFITEKLK